MSDISIISFLVAIGVACVEIAQLLGSACGAGIKFLHDRYLATPERESHLRALYNKTYVDLLSKDLSIHNFRTPNQMRALHVKAMYDSIINTEPMAFVAENKYNDGLLKAKSLVSSFDARSPSTVRGLSNNLLNEAESIIRNLGKDTHQYLSKLEDKFLFTNITESVKNLGYDIKRSDNLLVASKGALSIRGKLDNGNLILDTRSFPGLSCQKEALQIEDSLKQKGLLVRRTCANRIGETKVKLLDPFPSYTTGFSNSRSKDMNIKPDQVHNRGLSQEQIVRNLHNKTKVRVK